MQSLSHKHIASLSALMMFAPLISYQIDHFGLDFESKKFVWSYIRIWYFVIAIVFISIGISLIWHQWNIPYTTYISTWCMCIALCIMVIGIIMIFQDKTRWQISLTPSQDPSSQTLSLDTMINLLPGYNIYQWYQGKHDYLIQESIILWTLYLILIILFPNLRIAVLGMIGVITISIMHIIYPIIDNKRNQGIKSSFTTNIEEIYGKYIWMMIYYSQSLISHISGREQSHTLAQSIESFQSEYSALSSLQGNYKLIAEYVILWLIIAGSIISYMSQNHYQIWSWLLIMPSIVIAIRYLLMFYIDQFVAIPIIHEWVWLIIFIFTFIHHRHPDEQNNLP